MTIASNEIVEFADWNQLPPDPIVSVHMLAYKHGKYIAKAIGGVLAQKCDFPFELIIAEDCSPDDTLEIALQHQKQHPEKIRVLTSRQNVGGKQNERRCQLATRGVYVAICEGDDFWNDELKLAKQVSALRSNPRASMTCHAAFTVDELTGINRRVIRSALRTRKLSLMEIVAGDGGLIPTASIMAKKEVLLSRPPWAESAPIGDYPLAIKAALMGDVLYFNEPMCSYRINVPGSWTMRNMVLLESRVEHATKLETMFLHLAREEKILISRVASAVVSKHYSDALVCCQTRPENRKMLYSENCSKIVGSDRILAWLAAVAGIRLIRTKAFFRKSKTLRRMIRYELTSRFHRSAS